MERIREFLDYAERYGQEGARVLPDGRARFYGTLSPAKTQGTMIGRRMVREWNPETGATRIWHETVDAAGNVRQVRPEEALTGGSEIHYMFDADGNFTGSW